MNVLVECALLNDFYLSDTHPSTCITRKYILDFPRAGLQDEKHVSLIIRIVPFRVEDKDEREVHVAVTSDGVQRKLEGIGKGRVARLASGRSRR